MPESIDIYRFANLLIQQHGTNAAIQAAMRADDMLARGDVKSTFVWKRIVTAVNELQRRQRRHDEWLN